jgi:hypothetical protein
MRKLINIITVILGLFLVSSCSESYLDTKPSDAVSEEEAFASLDGVNANLDGVLRMMKSKTINDRHDEFGVVSIGLAQDLMGGDVVAGASHWFTSDYNFTYSVFANYTRPYFIWSLNYRIIYNCNKIIASIDKIVSDNVEYKESLKGQAYILRAYAYLNLVQAFGPQYTVANRSAAGVPIYKVADLNGKKRSTVGEVYDFIISDLKAAETAFVAAGNTAAGDMSHPTIAVSYGMYARVALIMADYTVASSKAMLAYNSSRKVMSRDSYAKGFDDSNEQTWMWGFVENKEQSGIYRGFFSHIDMTNSGGYAGGFYNAKLVWNNLYANMLDGDIRKDLIHDLNKEENDAAKAAATASGKTPNYSDFGIEGFYLANYKFSGLNGKGFASDLVMMRPAEMLLIAAEAKYRAGGDGSTELKMLMNARYDKIASQPAVSLAEVMLQRRYELWGEGNRFSDIKRLALDQDRSLGANLVSYNADGSTKVVVMSNHKTSLNRRAGMKILAGSKYFTYLIPQKELDSNPNMTAADQNEL